MTGDNVVPLIVNLYTFGARDFDVKTALRYMVSGATQGGVGRGGYVERPGITTYLERGYAPQTNEFRADHNIVGASITLEWSVDDFTISRFADALGDTVTAAEFQNRAQYWQNLFNPATGYLSPRNADGAFPSGPASWRLSGASARTDTTRATPSNTCGWCRRMSPAWSPLSAAARPRPTGSTAS
ncbi:glycosyl hydrolase 92 family protein [Mycobacterium kansasii 824]|nr:glycosyl hydrolase 92 family protein [Mycobacterium kansasii 824]